MASRRGQIHGWGDIRVYWHGRLSVGPIASRVNIPKTWLCSSAPLLQTDQCHPYSLLSPPSKWIKRFHMYRRCRHSQIILHKPNSSSGKHHSFWIALRLNRTCRIFGTNIIIFELSHSYFNQHRDRKHYFYF